jgi:hypothetical protein
MLLRHESCIRRGFRHEPLRIGCRIHPETWFPVIRVSRLAELGRTCSRRVAAGRARFWSLVGLPLAQHPVAGFGEVSSDGNDGPAMSLAWREPLKAAQLDLQNAIADARDAGCPVSPEAEEWAEKPPPSCPE